VNRPVIPDMNSDSGLFADSWCCRCNKRCDQITVEKHPLQDVFKITAHCHGEQQTQDICGKVRYMSSKVRIVAFEEHKELGNG